MKSVSDFIPERFPVFAFCTVSRSEKKKQQAGAKELHPHTS
jgi:hypothetical protein